MSTATSNRLNLAAEPRELVGKKVAGLRREGRLPAVVFGQGLGSENVSIDAHEFDLLRRKAGQNALIDLSVHGKKARPVLVHGVMTVAMPPSALTSTAVLSRSNAKSAVRGQTLSHCVSVQRARLRTSEASGLERG